MLGTAVIAPLLKLQVAGVIAGFIEIGAGIVNVSVWVSWQRFASVTTTV